MKSILILVFAVLAFAQPSFALQKRILHMNGYNADVDTGTEDLFPAGGSATIPTAAAATTVLSSSANDTAAGTGVRTVRVKGLIAGNKEAYEDVSMNGTSAVTLTNSFMKIWSVEQLTSGSGLTNAGTIDVKHSSTVLIRMAIGAGKSQNAFFSAPDSSQWPVVRVKRLYGALMNQPTAGVIIFKLLTRSSATAGWQLKALFSVYAQGQISSGLDVDIPLAPGEDARLSATATVDNSEVTGGFEVEMGSASLF